jgi:AP-2 complex subunit alpha
LPTLFKHDHSSSHRTSQTFVKKKAALTLLRLYRKHPEVIPAAEWALRLVSIMDDPDLARFQAVFSYACLTNNPQGVVLCVTSLVMALAQDHLDAFAVCYTKAVDRLYRVSTSYNHTF